ncbi:NDR1/HIN1-like protein 13 [Salvia miltiorrhiza]|uniref:NDR1/HIN1-like protein 13 n=1 Tax=Salvia miltiorrhiza TaxID=226208 RepID=UPI0025AD1703|nr:NDR1/HIN1-like protein 13 [Salvia miltiorrhiza]
MAAAADPPSTPSPAAASQTNSDQNQKSSPTNPVPPPATYVVRIPREQILRYPPPENAKKYDKLRRGRNRRSFCCRCCCFASCLLFLLIFAAAVSAGVMYLVFGFKSPTYTVTKVSVHGMNLTSASPISPGFDVSIRAENPNGKVGIYYLKESAVNVLYDGVTLGYGVLADFYQPRKNVTVLRSTVAANDVVLGGAVKTALRNAESLRRVPLVVSVEAPVKFKVGSVKTWEITAKISCDVVLDSLNERAEIVSKDCDYSVRLW